MENGVHVFHEIYRQEKEGERLWPIPEILNRVHYFMAKFFTV